MMILKDRRVLPLLVIYSLTSFVHLIESLTIQQANGNQQHHHTGKTHAKLQQQQHSSSTTNNNITAQQSATKHLEQTLNDVSLNDVGSEPRSVSYDHLTTTHSMISPAPMGDHDESVPLATINNHSSRNSQPPPQTISSSSSNNNIRPPQYVDVSNLVARNANASSTLASGGAGGLQAKSRSGLPECATQQVCNAIFVRMNYTQKLCECSSNYNWRCSNNLDPQDGHTIELTRKFDKRIYTQIKTCEPLREVRPCKSPTDWTLLALQSERSGKAHYVVVCKCPTWASLEGPYTHNHPPYANIPGIRVYGMLCAHQTARSSAQTYSAFNPSLNTLPEFPWSEALNVLNTTNLHSTLD